jgi:hypothetical protein
MSEVKVFTPEQVDAAVKAMRAKHEATKETLRDKLTGFTGIRLTDEDLERLIDGMERGFRAEFQREA